VSKNPFIKIISFSHAQGRYGDHSICIMYEEIE
jgi:hypothetical protein